MAHRKTKIHSKKTPTHAYDKAVFGWHAPEYHKSPKGRVWFVAASTVLIGVVLYGVLTGGWTFSVATLVFAGVYLLIHVEEPRHVPIKVSHVGVKVGRHCFPYSNMRAFWIVYEPPFVKKLHFRTGNGLIPDVSISLEDQDPAALKAFVAIHVPEWEGKGESFSDLMVRLLRL